MAKYDLDNTTLGQLLEDAEVQAIFDQHAPGLRTNPMIGMAKGMMVNQAISMAGGMVSADDLAAIKSAVQAL